jgi:hypothetical protein
MQSATKTTIGKFPLRLVPSTRRSAEEFSQKEGVSLNQFINIAVAEKLAHLQYEEWLSARPRLTQARTARALAALDKSTGKTPDAGDALPQGYISISGSVASKSARRVKR